MQVKTIMTRSVDLVDPNTTIRDAAMKMRDDDVGALPVGENDRLVGMITDRDIAIRAVAENKAPSQTAVRDVMSEGICYCFEDDAVDDAARIMADRQVRRLPVLNRDKRLVGIVALADIARSGATKAEEQAIEGVSQPSDQARR
jgi:CBS domain-containing protein